MGSAKNALVAGATGLVGSNVVQHLETLDDWRVTSISRRPEMFSRSSRHVALDLTDSAACHAVFENLTDVTHVFFAAYRDTPSLGDQITPNLTMLSNAVECVEQYASRLRHVSLVTGAKHYGSHLGRWTTPARESAPRHLPPNFYYAQEDFLRQRQVGKSWTWSVTRPGGLAGIALGNPLNLVTLLAVYATITRALGLPLRFPGSEQGYGTIYQATSARLLAKAMTWAATELGCANQSFNIVNGDLTRWNELWPVIAEYFEIPVGPAQPMDLVRIMADKGSLWDEIARQHQLRDIPLNQLVNWEFGNYCFQIDYDMVSDLNKCRAYGFFETVDTPQMFRHLFDELRVKRIIP